MSKTTITHPDGSHTVIQSSSGCGSSCSSCLLVVAVLYVIAAPAEYFPLWLAVMAYAFEAFILVAAGLKSVAKRREGGAG